jgi:hypothetical protein
MGASLVHHRQNVPSPDAPMSVIATAVTNDHGPMVSSPTPEKLLDRLVAALEAAGKDEARKPEARSELHQVASALRTAAAPIAIAALGADPDSNGEPGPSDPTLSFFAYGIFAPGQIAFFQIKSYVRETIASSVPGILRIRDGLPILDAALQSEVVNGHRIEFNKPADAELAYESIRKMEPRTQYRWDSVGDMNVLFGRSPAKGASPMEPDGGNGLGWSSWSDPAFDDALRMVEEICTKQRDWDDLRPFYRLQGAYMVLWSSIERYVSLRYGLGRNDKVLQRVKLLAKESQFVESLRATDPLMEKKLRNLFRSDDPRKRAVVFDCSDPDEAIDYLYQVRSNVTHRGKAERLDWDLLKTATSEALRIFQDVLRAAEEDAQWSGASR